ncbi:MAG: hypothetical protein HOC23_02130 [Halieaceae bacterium]|jgi:hypothetical protein|nr:hypothetical protein [Halieaceae bacterium]
MNRLIDRARWTIGTVILGAAITLGLGGISLAAMDMGYSVGHENSDGSGRSSKLQSAFEPDDLYAEECGACHLAYPPGLLPMESWHNMMLGLGDHFGENAELDNDALSHITAYISRNALKPGRRSTMSKMLRNLPESAPARITELPYFVHEHDEVIIRAVEGNPELSSISQCDSCHSGAERGEFDDDRIIIPGFGRWND